MVTRAALVLAILAVAGAAHAENPKLVAARAAIVGVHYDDAKQLLGEALALGGSSAREVAEIYRLSARTEAVLGHDAAAEQDARRWFALEPAATLPDDLAPKLREPFTAARAYVTAHGHLTVEARWRNDRELEVTVASDPLAMVATITVAGAPVTLDASHRAIAKPAGEPDVVALDDHGNHLVEIDHTALPRPRPTTPEHVVILADPPVVQRPSTWVTASGVLLGAGAVSLVLAIRSDHELADIVAHSQAHTFADATTARDHRDLELVGTYTATALAGACAITALVLYRTHRAPVAVSAASGGGSISWSTTW